MHQTVRVTREIPDQGVAKGMIGAVIEVFDAPEPAYEVEFVDAEGRTVLQATLAEQDLEIIGDGGPDAE